MIWCVLGMAVALDVITTPVHRLVTYIALALAIQGLFLAAIIYNFNLRLRDPSMSAEQILVGFFWVVIAFTEAPELKGVIALVSIMVMLYSIFDFIRHSFYLVPCIAIAGMVIANLSYFLKYPYDYDWRYNLIEFISYSLIVTWVAIIANYSQKMRDRLKAQRQEIAKANRMLASLSLEDPLTGLKNRRYFDTHFDNEWKRAQREHTPLALIMVDIDHFKQVNDTYGHQAGDHTLQLIGNIFTKVVRRPSDIICRYGGEEFALLLPNTALDSAVDMAESILKRLRSANLQYRDQSISVTASMGVAASRPNPHNQSSDLLRAADMTMYRAKQEGRDRVAIAQELHLAALTKSAT
ncbi:GGDEF domain-containing protein [Exilibacterium tricleocarpae]|nr:GGDEF domain-containing protein [Exilibacterium tricleocarpae]